MWFSVYFVLGQSIVIGPSDFEWLFLNSSLGIRARLFCYVIHYSELCGGFLRFFAWMLLFRSQCNFPFSASNNNFVLVSSSTFIYVSASFMFLLLVSFAFSVWIYRRLDFLVLFPFEDEPQLSLRLPGSFPFTS